MSAKTLVTAVGKPPRPIVGWRRVNPTVVVFLLLLAAICWISPLYRTAPGLMSLLQRASSVVILSCGQTFVLVTGGFDLAVGSLITLTVVACALITGGSLPVNLRFFGRYVWRHVPLVESLPVAVVVLAISVTIMAWLLHGTNFGRLLMMIGDNPRAAEMSGVPVRWLRMTAFVISALAAVTAGILLGGFSGVSVDVGTGYELQAIAAAVIGGVVLLGGEGSIAGAGFGGLTVYALFTLLNLVGFPEPLRVAVQGIILVAAAALTARRVKS